MAFALLFMLVTVCGSALRPPSTVLMMQSIEGDTGIVISLITCGGLLFGSLSMFLATLPFWPDPVIAVGTISALTGAICCAVWMKGR